MTVRGLVLTFGQIEPEHIVGQNEYPSDSPLKSVTKQESVSPGTGTMDAAAAESFMTFLSKLLPIYLRC